jgi:pimeloyl-ACP methyl ester carboxylesterase
VSDPPPPATDPAPRTADLQGRRLAYIDEGPEDAPAILAFPGIPGTSRDFRYLAPQLTDSVRLIRVDPPGFGDSAPERDAIRSFQGRARILLALADHLRLARFAVLGHSMGGGAALVAASSFRRRVSLLVLVASVALRRHRGLGYSSVQFRRMGRALRVPGLGALLVPKLREQYRRRGFSGSEKMRAHDFALHMEAIAAADFDLLRRCVAEGLPPTLIAYAQDDHLVETHLSRELAAAIPHARVLLFDEGGHNLQKTRARELAQAIKEMLAS